MTFTPDLQQALVFDHGWSLPVAVGRDIFVADTLAQSLNEVMGWDQFDGDHATGHDFDTLDGPIGFPKVGYYYDADRMTLVRDEDEDDLDALVRLLNAIGWEA